MRRGQWRGRRLTVLIVCVAAAFAATATVLSVSIAATGTLAAAKSKARHKSAGLTKSEVLALIKQYAKPGPAGAKGATGATGAIGNAGAKGENGTKGENGAVAGYSASQPLSGAGESTEFTSGTAAAPKPILSKSLPAGNYMASGKVETSMFSTDPKGEGDVNCALSDTPASGAPAVDISGFFSEIEAFFPTTSSFGTAITIPLEVAVSTTSASTLSIACWVNAGYGGENALHEPGKFAAYAAHAHIQAVQTTTNS